MSKVIHYDTYDGGSESGEDLEYDLYCGTYSEDPKLSPYEDHVTCKRCLKLLEKRINPYTGEPS